MSGGGDHTYYIKKSTMNALEQLKKHPNYKKPIPQKSETKTQFILRSVSELISPPMEEQESNEIECIDLAQAVRLMEPELELIWRNRKKN